MRGNKKNRGLSLAAGLLLAALTLGMKASAQPEWLPTRASHRAAERGETCSVLRQLQTDNRQLASTHQTVLEAQIAKIKGYRESLVTCAKTKGVPMNVGDLSESAMAEYCGPQFAVWIHQGYQLEMIRQDLVQARKDLQWVTTQLVSNCPAPGQGATPAKSARRSPRGDGALAKRTGEGLRRRGKKSEPRMAWLRGNELPE